MNRPHLVARYSDGTWQYIVALHGSGVYGSGREVSSMIAAVYGDEKTAREVAKRAGEGWTVLALQSNAQSEGAEGCPPTPHANPARK